MKHQSLLIDEENTI